MPCLQILYNLVGNSAKFTTDGSITVMLKAMPCSDPGKEFVQLSVRDTGCGISKEKQRDMFVPFGQVIFLLLYHGWPTVHGSMPCREYNCFCYLALRATFESFAMVAKIN